MKRSVAVVVVVLIAIAIFFGGFVYANKTSEREKDRIGSALVGAIGKLVGIYREAGSTKKSKDDLRSVIREQTLVLLALGPNIEELDASGFEGMCTLISGSDFVFQDDGIEPVWQQANHLIRSQLAMQRQVLAAELTRRRGRPANPPACPGF